MFRRLSFDVWYLFRPPWDTGISPPELLNYIDEHAPGRALDLGCGTGTNTITLARAGWMVTGVDFSRLAICLAHRKIRLTGLRANLFPADVTRPLPLEGLFDLVLDIGCYHAAHDRPAYLDNLVRLLRAGGHWLMYAFMADGDTPDTIGLTASQLEQISAAGLTLLSRTDGFDRASRPSAWFLFTKIK